MSKTKIITIEGIDGSGKTVQFELLTKGLQDRGFTVQKRAYPVYDAFFGEQVGRFLSCSEGVSASTVDQKSMALWFAMDRFMDFRNYRDGEADFLLINRYVLSNAVYQSIRERDISEPDSNNSAFADWVFRLEYDVLGLPRPTLNLFFDVDTECARARAKYREMSKRFSDTVIIPCTENGAMLPPETISNAVFELLRKRGLI